jgi:hypothetical protein
MNERELDLTVLHKLFGVKRVYYPSWDTQKESVPQYIPSGKPLRTHKIDLKPIPRYSSDANACYYGLKLKLAERFHWVITSPFEKGQPWFAGLTPLNVTGWNGIPDFKEQGESEMIAACQVALRAMGFDPETPDLPQIIVMPED